MFFLFFIFFESKDYRIGRTVQYQPAQKVTTFIQSKNVTTTA